MHTLPDGVIDLGPWRADDSEFAVTVSSARRSSDVYSVDRQSLQSTRWTESELGGLVSSELSEPELITWKSFDERVLSGFLYRPPQRFAGKHPLIINIHGGPEGQSRPTFLGRNNYFLNELGCAILFPNVRGSTGYGKSFLKLDNGQQRLDSVRDIGALLDWIGMQAGSGFPADYDHGRQLWRLHDAGVRQSNTTRGLPVRWTSWGFPTSARF